MGETACKAKVILNGTTAEGFLEGLCEMTVNLTPEEVARMTDQVIYPVIRRLNKAEALILQCHRLMLRDVVQFEGPLPAYLSSIPDSDLT